MRLQTRLILLFLAATLTPLAITAWLTMDLLDRSLRYATIQEVDELSRDLELTGRELYQLSRQQLHSDVAANRITPVRFRLANQQQWPANVARFWEDGVADDYRVEGERGESLNYLVRDPDGVRLYRRPISRVGMTRLRSDITNARDMVEKYTRQDVRRGLTLTLLTVGTATWILALLGFLYAARRVSQPIKRLTDALGAVASGELNVRVPVNSNDEVGAALVAFNHMSDQLQQSRERLVFLTRLSSWQALGRKMAHEVKNSLTPIRLTVEEMVVRHDECDPAFLQQAAQIVSDEISTLERRVRAFSELAAEPPVRLEEIDLQQLVEERISFLRPTQPGVELTCALPEQPWHAWADTDLLRGVLTNLLTNASEAMGGEGRIQILGGQEEDAVWIEVHDAGPGLSAHARQTLFEPTISFKKTGMGLGLSISRKSALLCGGELTITDSRLGGAAFRLTLPAAPSLHSDPRNVPDPQGVPLHAR